MAAEWIIFGVIVLIIFGAIIGIWYKKKKANLFITTQVIIMPGMI